MLLKGSLNLSWSYLLRKLEQTTEVLGYIPVQPTRGRKGKFGKDEERLESEEGVVPRTGTLEFVFEELFRGMRGGIGLEEGNGIGIALWWRDEGKVRGSLYAFVCLVPYDQWERYLQWPQAISSCYPRTFEQQRLDRNL